VIVLFHLLDLKFRSYRQTASSRTLTLQPCCGQGSGVPRRGSSRLAVHALDSADMARRWAAVNAIHATKVARKILCPRPGYPEPVAMNATKTANSASIISDRIMAKRWSGRHLSSWLKLREMKIVAGMALKNAIRPLVAWMVPGRPHHRSRRTLRIGKRTLRAGVVTAAKQPALLRAVRSEVQFPLWPRECDL
jgi:hypothetical protein